MLPESVPTLVLVLLGSYLVGALPFGYLVARARGVNIFEHGSGNIGATNIGRVLGRRFGILVFLLDFAKGVVPVAAATWLASAGPARSADPLAAEVLRVGAGLAAFLGHLFPVYLRFRGGKGVATGAGVVAVLLPWPALAAFLTWLTVFTATRYMSVASLTAVVVLCLVRLGGPAAPEVTHALGAGLTTQPFAPAEAVLTAFCFVAALLVGLRHRANIGRLRRGVENRFQDTPAMLTLAKTVHVLSLGLWFGSVVFFFLATAVIFHAFGTLAGRERPPWLALPADLTQEQATRLAGVAIGPLFDWYFPLQFCCGLLALIPALAWAWSEPGGANRARAIALALAFLTVLAGWPMARYVGQLRTARYTAETAASAPGAPPETAATADAARQSFGRWHGYSLLLNFVTLALVAVGMALAARLPLGSGDQVTRDQIVRHKE